MRIDRERERSVWVGVKGKRMSEGHEGEKEEVEKEGG